MISDTASDCTFHQCAEFKDKPSGSLHAQLAAIRQSISDNKNQSKHLEGTDTVEAQVLHFPPFGSFYHQIFKKINSKEKKSTPKNLSEQAANVPKLC